MSERGLDPESFLTEIDRRLRAIQDELRPGEAGSRRSPPGQAAIWRADADRSEPSPLGPPSPPRRGRSGPLAAILGRNRPPAKPAKPAQPAEPAEPAPEAPAAPPGGPAAEAGHAAAEASPAPPAAELVEQVRALTRVQTDLLAASERLLEAFAGLIRDAPPPGLFAPTVPVAPRSGVSVSAGPFPDTEALREFERALSELQPVHSVTVRAYEGEDRAILDIELEPRRASAEATT
jgi:hypothetical protein